MLRLTGPTSTPRVHRLLVATENDASWMPRHTHRHGWPRARLDDANLIHLPRALVHRRAVASPSPSPRLVGAPQVGCKQGCVFCATGRMGEVRSLSADEILAQVWPSAARRRCHGMSHGVIGCHRACSTTRSGSAAAPRARSSCRRSRTSSSWCACSVRGLWFCARRRSVTASVCVFACDGVHDRAAWRRAAAARTPPAPSRDRDPARGHVCGALLGCRVGRGRRVTVTRARPCARRVVGVSGGTRRRGVGARCATVTRAQGWPSAP